MRSIFCQNSFIRTRILALTTALSKDNEISRMHKIATSRSACGPPSRGRRSVRRP